MNDATSGRAAARGPSYRVLIAGCGDVGTALGLMLWESGHRVFGARRSAHRLPASLCPLSIDPTDHRVVGRTILAPDIVVYAVAAGRRERGPIGVPASTASRSCSTCWRSGPTTSSRSFLAVSCAKGTVRTPSGPESTQAEGDRIEGADAHRLVVLRARDQEPLPVVELEGFEGAVRRVDEPQVGATPSRA